MKTVSPLKRWFSALLLLVFVAAVCTAIAVVLLRFELMTPVQAGLLATALFCGGVLFKTQFTHSRDIKTLRRQTPELEEYESDIHRRIERLSEQIATDGLALEKATDQKFEVLVSEMTTLQDRIDALENTRHAKRSSSSRSASNAAQPDHATVSNSVFSAGKKRIEDVKTSNITKAVNDESLNMHLQPIVGLPSRKPVYFDAFMRLAIGSNNFLDQEEFTKLAEQGGLMPAIDKKIIFSSIRMLRKLTALNKQVGVFCQVSAKTLSKARSMNEIKSFLQANQELSNYIIIEVSQRDFAALDKRRKERLAEFSDMGIALALVNVLDLNLDATGLANFGVRFVKIPVSILIHANIAHNGDELHPTSLSSVLEKKNIGVIATEIERDNDAVSLIDLDVKLAQGLLFAPPRPVKSDLLNTPTPQSMVQ